MMNRFQNFVARLIRRSALAAVLLAGAFALVPLTAAASTELAQGDVVRISVYDNSDLTTVVRIASNGRITFPLIGDVSIGGLSAAQAEQNISQLLENGGFVRNAQVSVFVEERGASMGRSVTVLGQVKSSGRFPLQEESSEGVTSLVDLLAVAGGTNDNAADYLYLIRQQGKQSRKIEVDLVALLRQGDISANIFLSDGDIVLVPQMDVFYIYGQVQRPGKYRLERGMTVMQAVSVASGITETGSEKGIVLNRKSDKGLQSISSGLTDELRPDDVIYVKSSFF
jgi:polysaccharide export outer membrane protein